MTANALDPSTSSSGTADVIDAHDRYLSLNYPRYPVVMQRGEGVLLWNADGKRYVDLFAGFGGPILGHCHPAAVAAVCDQAHKLWHVGNLFHTEPQTRLARHISETGFGGRSFFCHSGADANEAALKLARLYGKAHPGDATTEHGRFAIIACDRGFHGRSFGTMRATANPKVREGFDPLPPGYTHVPFNDLDAVTAAITPETVAVLVEPIQGEGGVHVPHDSYLPGLRRLCDDRDLLLIVDEVWTGCGRTGRMFAHQHWLDAEHAEGGPDIMTLAKGVGGGLPVGVMCARPEIAELYDARKQGGVKHATTLGGNCLSMASAAAVFEVIQRDGLIERAATLGEGIKDRLRRFAQSHPVIRDVRGRGLFLGIELDSAASDGRFATGAEVVQRCMDRGVLINATSGDVLRLAPPLTIDESLLDEGLSVMEAVLGG